MTITNSTSFYEKIFFKILKYTVAKRNGDFKLMIFEEQNIKRFFLFEKA